MASLNVFKINPIHCKIYCYPHFSLPHSEHTIIGHRGPYIATRIYPLSIQNQKLKEHVKNLVLSFRKNLEGY